MDVGVDVGGGLLLPVWVAVGGGEVAVDVGGGLLLPAWVAVGGGEVDVDVGSVTAVVAVVAVGDTAVPVFPPGAAVASEVAGAAATCVAGGGGAAATGTFSTSAAVEYWGPAEAQHSPLTPVGQLIFHQPPLLLLPIMDALCPARSTPTMV